jgi:cytosine/adenosine deaminase-related metal-dependent hydrolase
MMESIGDYIRSGINIAMGSDTEPHNMLEEMRLGLTLGRLSARNVRSVELSEIFAAATVGGARALGRDDLGRISVGAKADLVLLDLDCPEMMPVRDPLRSLVFTAADRAVRDVYVDGREVVRDGKPTMIDVAGVGRAAEKIQAGVMANVPHTDSLKRTAEQISPLTLARVQ